MAPAQKGRAGIKGVGRRTDSCDTFQAPKLPSMIPLEKFPISLEDAISHRFGIRPPRQDMYRMRNGHCRMFYAV